MDKEYLSKINPDFDDELINEMREYARENHVPIMQDDGIHLLIQLLKIARAKNVLEIGTAIGYSAILMASFSGVNVTTIERDSMMFQMAKQYVDQAGLNQKIHLIHGDANDIEIQAQNYDVLFIDAAKSSYIHFFDKFSKNVKTGGMIISDNLLFRGLVAHPEKIESRNRKQLVKKIDHYNHFLMNHPDFDSYIYAIGDGISISIKK